MYFGSIQFSGERVSSSDINEFCQALEAHKIKILSLRECGISKKNFMKLMVSLGYCKSILHLNLNHCDLASQERIDMLAATLNLNKSLNALLIHGNTFGTRGVVKIVKSLMMHPRITSLDVGDCDIGDRGLKHICELLPPSYDKPGLQELVISGNPRITPRAWEKFSVALSACSTLRALYIDFNDIGDMAGKMIVVSAAGHPTLSVLDMEACGISDEVARLLLHLLQRYPTALSHILLEDNDICEDTTRSIRLALGESESEDSDTDCRSPADSCLSEHEYEEIGESCNKRQAPAPTNCECRKPCPCQDHENLKCRPTSHKLQMKVKDNPEAEDGELVHQTDNVDTTYELSIHSTPRFEFPNRNNYTIPKNKPNTFPDEDERIYCEIFPHSLASDVEASNDDNVQSDLSGWETEEGDWLTESPRLTEHQKKRQALYVTKGQIRSLDKLQHRDSDDEFEYNAMHIFGKKNNELKSRTMGL